jgi:hypothetical protein
MTDLPEVKLKAMVNFPASAIGRTGITVVKDGGKFFLDLNYDDIQITPTVSAGDIPNSYNLIWDETKKIFSLVPFALQATSGVSSLALQTGAIDIDPTTLQMVGSTLKVKTFNFVGTIDGKFGAITLDSSLKTISNALAVNTVNLTGGVSSVVYTQSETSAVSSPMIRRLNNTLFASEFGAVGDDATNDYAALQAWLNAACSSGKEGRFDPGKKYYVSGNDLLLSSASGTRNLRFIGYGSQIRTNPAQARTGLKIQNTFPFIGRPDETRRTIVEGWFFSQYDDANAAWGIEVVGTPNVIIRDCSFANGSDTGVVPYINYAAIRARQTTNTNPDTGVFWMTIENCRFKGGANQMRNALWLEGAINAASITRNSFANVDVAIRFLCANSGGSTANDGYVGNGNRITDNSFEAILEAIKFTGLAGQSTCDGLIVSNNRIESITTAFFNYSGIDTEGFVQPMLGPNYLDSGSWGRYVLNTNALRVDVRDTVIGRATINPGSLAAGATTTIGTVTVAPAATGDQVLIEANGDLQGLLATGYVSAANTVTIRLTNPTTAAVDLPSLKWVARVRPQF